tara:strand:+ start:495 stop:1952 length:1458 start_codon:yes stop_codon:yes gene_type:complete
MNVPKIIPNWIGGKEVPASCGEVFLKLNPTNGQEICAVARSNYEDVDKAVNIADQVLHNWSEMSPVNRGKYLHKVVLGMIESRRDIAKTVCLETGKSMKESLGETDAAIELGLYYASEGQRLYGRTMSSSMDTKQVSTIREPVGIAGLIIAANTPIANVAWKVFPALICGNSVVLKAAEDTPVTAWKFGEVACRAGLPSGTLNIIQGYGKEAGQPLVEHPDVGVISFTGSSEIGLLIQEIAGKRLAKVSLELGGKNPFVVCEDADLNSAVKWASLSAFSNAGQRCASGSRIIVLEPIYNKFKKLLIKKTKELSLGSRDEDDLGPVINEKQMIRILNLIEEAKTRGARILTGGKRSNKSQHKKGFFVLPTIIENAEPEDEISLVELFGPITCLYRAEDFDHALELANNSFYGLTACIHTSSINTAMKFTRKVKSGMAVVNAGTYGSEPHMPFGGLKRSGNGSREPGIEALDIYTNTKVIHINYDVN